MAVAAEETRDLARWQNWIVGGEAFLLFFTLVATAMATRAAARAAKAATDAVHSDRAWICFETAETWNATNVTVDDKTFAEGILIRLVYKNTRRSPGTHVGIVREGFIVEESGPSPTWTDLDPEEFRGSAIVGPNAPFGAEPLSIVGDDLRRFIKREVKFCAHAFMAYRDVFNPSAVHFTETEATFTFGGYQKTADGKDRLILVTNVSGPHNRAA
jgi:hypothetical protein